MLPPPASRKAQKLKSVGMVNDFATNPTENSRTLLQTIAIAVTTVYACRYVPHPDNVTRACVTVKCHRGQSLSNELPLEFSTAAIVEWSRLEL